MGQNIIGSVPYTYTQDFGTTDITSWADNSTYLGWYAFCQNTGHGILSAHENITTAAPSNNGGFYTYECNGNNNEKIGSRASGGSGYIQYGVRFTNSSGSTIKSVTLSFDWYQLSLAGNGNVANVIQVGYRIAPSITDITVGAYNLITTFTAPLDTSSTSSGAQFRGLPCNVGGSVNICFDVNLTNGKDIMIEWVDINDANNDHHTAIDNVSMIFRTPNCGSLPIELLSFTGQQEYNCNLLTWITASEYNNDYFTLERSYDAVYFQELIKLKGAGNSSTLLSYSFKDTDPNNGINYYRLTQTDFNGQSISYTPISVYYSTDNLPILIKITDILGRAVSETADCIKIYYFSDGSILKKYKLTK